MCLYSHEPSRYMKSKPFPAPPPFPLHRPGICLHLPEPSPMKLKPVSILPPFTCGGMRSSAALGGPELGEEREGVGPPGAKTM